MKIRAFIALALIGATMALTGCNSTSLKNGESYSFARDCQANGLCGGGGNR